MYNGKLYRGCIFRRIANKNLHGIIKNPVGMMPTGFFLLWFVLRRLQRYIVFF